jgi:hypothetical protein
MEDEQQGISCDLENIRYCYFQTEEEWIFIIEQDKCLAFLLLLE